MATMKKSLWIAVVLILSLLADAVFAMSSSTEMSKMGDEETLVGASAATINCGGLCAVRCSKSSRPNLCNRACGTCCARCNCVPPGTYGGYETCPCYGTMTTHGGRRKCP